MTLKWFGAVSTRITLCRSNFSVSILWALAVSAIAMVKAMVFCMPKFPPIPALLQKPSGLGAVPGQGSRRVRGAKSFVIGQHTQLLKPAKRPGINDWPQLQNLPG